MSPLLRFFPAAVLLLQCAGGVDRPEYILTGPVSPVPVPAAASSAGDRNGGGGNGNGASTIPAFEAPVNVSDPSVILVALVEAYPQKAASPEIREGEWSVLIGGVPYYWAGGRMLPAELKERSGDFSSYSFRPNPPELPPLRELSDDEKERLKSRIGRRESLQDGRHPAFMNALWGMEDQNAAEQTVVRIEFLGRSARIHPDLLNPLRRVEARIQDVSRTDADTAAWLKELNAVSAYNWRDIAGSANRSLHSYGIAVDLTPVSYGGKQAYWRWASDFIDEWWAVPYTERYRIPDPVVRAFEDNGFIWGGKWFLFDQIHFEYRPELLILGEFAEENRPADN